MDKTKNHLWYLSDECIALCLFDKNVSREDKQAVAKKMLELAHKSDQNETEPVKRIILKKVDIPSFITKSLADFVTPNTYAFFERFQLGAAFLYKEPQLWEDDLEFQNAYDIISSLRVVNDTAERGVKLMEEFNKVLTNKEDEKQYLLQVVTDYRKNFPSYEKKDLRSSN